MVYLKKKMVIKVILRVFLENIKMSSTSKGQAFYCSNSCLLLGVLSSCLYKVKIYWPESFFNGFQWFSDYFNVYFFFHDDVGDELIVLWKKFNYVAIFFFLSLFFSHQLRPAPASFVLCSIHLVSIIIHIMFKGRKNCLLICLDFSFCYISH